MPALPITDIFIAASRAQWREWLATNHATAKEIWLISVSEGSSSPNLSYLDAVEEALCFGWIDSIAKKAPDGRLAQRFSPRRPKSNWTELNKIRARRLIDAGLMTPAGFATLPDLDPAAFRIAPDILAALQADDAVWRNFQAFPDDYKRIRIGYIEEMRRTPDVFKTRLENFLNKTRANKQFGIVR